MNTRKWPTTLMLMRHGQSERNLAKDLAKAEGKSYNWSEAVRDQDTPLTDLGMMQTLAVGVELQKRFPYMYDHDYVSFPNEYPKGKKIDIIYVSPYLRAIQSAEQVCKGLGYTPEIVREERIREIEFGILDGLSPEGIRVKYPEEVARRKKEGKYWYRPPGGQNRPDVNLQIHSFLGTLTRSARGKNVLISCHSVIVMCFRHLLERWGEEEYLEVDREQDVKNASVTTYECQDWTKPPNKLILKSYNEVLYP